MTHPFESSPAPPVHHSLLSPGWLAGVVRAEYGLEPPVGCSLLHSGVNDVYLVQAGGRKYILRIAHASRYGPFGEGDYRFELEMLDHLGRRHVPIAPPLRRRDGDLLGSLEAPEGRRYYALFHFLEGTVRSSLSGEDGYALGEALARLHLAMDGFSSPHPRFPLDEDFLVLEPMRRLGRFPGLPAEDLALLEKLSASWLDCLRALPRQAPVYGIVHGDFWWNNVHFTQAGPAFFDFDFCGPGWRAYDIACLRGSARALDSPLPDQVVDSFLHGYRSVRGLTGPELEALAVLEKVRLLWVLGLWTAAAGILGTKWFLEMFAWTFSSLRKWVLEEGIEK